MQQAAGVSPVSVFDPQYTEKGDPPGQCHLVKTLARRALQSKVCRNMYLALFL